MATLSGTPDRGWIHMNAAGASPVAARTHEAVISHLELEKAIGGYAAAARSKSGAHAAIALLLGCASEEVAIVDSSQAAWSRAFYSLKFRRGDRILCFESEYAGNAVAFLQTAKRTGATVEVLPMRADGIIDVDALSAALTRPGASGGGGGAGGRVLVALTHLNTDSSIVQPAREVGTLCAAHGALYLLDTCQSVGQLAVNVKELGCDFACGCGRKWLRGPRGTGFLYARLRALQATAADADMVDATDIVVAATSTDSSRSSSNSSNSSSSSSSSSSLSLVGEPPMLDHAAASWTSPSTYTLQPDARRYEMWECSEALRHGLAAAARLCLEEGPGVIFTKATGLARRLRLGLGRVPGLVMRDAPPLFDEEAGAAAGAARAAIVCFEAETHHGVPAAALHDALAARQVGASVSSSGHSFAAAARARPAVLRLSPSYFNTEADVDAAVEAIKEALEELAPAAR